jgi:DNA-binding NarL/FixJ family response regulator
MRILMVDDQFLIRESLRSVLKEAKPEAVIHEASDCGQAMQIISDHPDIGLILLDLSLPDRDGFSVLSELRENYPGVSVVILSGLQDRDNVKRALDLGASGFIPKSGRREVMLGALQLIFAGGLYIPPEILASDAADVASLPVNASQPAASPSDIGLTERQLEVLALIMQGKNNKVICRSLDLAESTVKNTVTAIYKALKVSSRTEAVIAVNALGWKLPDVQGS